MPNVSNLVKSIQDIMRKDAGTEVRENWHDSKQRFGRDQLLQSLQWMRKNNLVPQGRAPHTIHQPQLRLH